MSAYRLHIGEGLVVKYFVRVTDSNVKIQSGIIADAEQASQQLLRQIIS